MADRRDIDFSYTLTDKVIRLALGELADFSGAKYDGDFSLTLEQAQRRKKEYIAEQIGIESGRRVLDLGCGWGGMLDFVRERGATGLGVTLSSAQQESCRRHGLDVTPARRPGRHRRHIRSVRRGRQPRGVRALRSPEDYDAGRQDDVYRRIFANVASVLPEQGSVLPADDGVRAQHDRRRARSTGTLRANRTPGTWR